MKKNLKVLVLGGTGLVGGELINLMLKDDTISSITSLVRSPKGINHPKLNEEIIDFENLEKMDHYFEKKDAVFCCLGTTIKKVKGDKMLFRKVDLEYPVKACETALEKKVKHFIMVSSLGADANSPFFYNQVKGECENRVKSIGVENVSILRPSLLVGKRNESRPLEMMSMGIMKVVNPLLPGGLKKYRSVAGTDVARLMLALAKEDNEAIEASAIEHYTV